MFNNFRILDLSWWKRVLVVLLIGSTLLIAVHTKTKEMPVVEKIELNKYLGKWYEIARKPFLFQNKCYSNVSAKYSLNENANINVDNSCYSKDGKLLQAIGEAFTQNAPFNSKLKVSFLPKAIRFLPIGRGDYWILKINDNYQTVLVGVPSRKYMWILSRSQNLDEIVVQDYLDYAKEIGFDVSDIIMTKQINE
jgi:apolipoprotein D and lipocalin family protein